MNGNSERTAARHLGDCCVDGCEGSRADLDTPYCLLHGCIVIHCHRRRRHRARTCEQHRDAEPV